MTVRMEPGFSRRLWVIVTSMGRRSFVERTLASVLSNIDATYCLVDYSCPDQSGRWVREHFPDPCASGQLEVVTSEGHSTFHKAAALNLGARRAIQRGAEYLCFLDADTLVFPGAGTFILENVHPLRFLVALDGRSLFGFLVVPARTFETLGGFDETIVGYGGEDIEMRLRLSLVGGLSYVELPPRLLHGIPHPAELRTRHYAERDPEVTNAKNLSYVRERVRAWTGADLLDLDPSIVRLYQGRRKQRAPIPRTDERTRRTMVLRARLRAR